ncbi:MAG: DUF5723 family protein [Salinivirgaceae bacterium]
MKQQYKLLIALTLGLFFWMGSYAQQPLSLYYLENIPQSSFINPAMAPRANAFFGIPGANSIYLGVNTDLLGSQLFQKAPDGSDVTLTSKYFDYSELYKRIGKAGNLSPYFSIAPIAFGFSGKKGYFTFTWSEKVNASMNLPKDFFTLPDIGGFPNGTHLDFSPLAMNAQYYRELSFGYSYKFMSKLRVGAHVKLLQGLAAMKTDLEKFDIQTSTDEWLVDMEGSVYLSAPITVTTDENNVPDGMEDFDSSTKNIIEKGLLNFSNPGIAFDLGAVYEYNPSWTFSASVNDLGFIKWGGDLTSLTANGTYRFNGIHVDESNIDSLGGDYIIETVLDSLKNAVNLQRGSQGFSTGLGPKIYLGAKYNVNHYFALGAVSRTSFYKNDFQQEFNVSANLNLYHFLTTSVNYTLAVNGANSVGFALGIRGGALQFYLAADYLPYKWRPYTINFTADEGEQANEPIEIPQAPKSFDNFNLMLGFNLLFGANGFRDEPMIDAYESF